LLQHSVDKASSNVQSLEIAKRKGRELLTVSYQLIEDLFHRLDCDQKLIVSWISDVACESANDGNILLYLAAIESHVQQLLPIANIHRKRGRDGYGHIDEPTISWRIHHHHNDQPFTSLSTAITEENQYPLSNLDHIDNLMPSIPL
jgi:hypothetical protein